MWWCGLCWFKIISWEKYRTSHTLVIYCMGRNTYVHTRREEDEWKWSSPRPDHRAPVTKYFCYIASWVVRPETNPGSPEISDLATVQGGGRGGGSRGGNWNWKGWMLYNTAVRAFSIRWRKLGSCRFTLSGSNMEIFQNIKYQENCKYLKIILN